MTACDLRKSIFEKIVGSIAPSGGSVFTPLSLFASAENGAWIDASDLSTLYTDAAGTILATPGDPIGRWTDKSGNGNHATQSTAAARMTITGSGPYYLQPDGVDDNFAFPLGASFVGDFALVLNTGIVFGSIDTGSDSTWNYTKDPLYIPDGNVHAIIVIDRALTAVEKTKIVTYYSSVVNSTPSTAVNVFRGRVDLTDIDLNHIDFSLVTNAESAFNGCSKLISSPNVGGWVNVTNATGAFNGCSKLTTPPDVSGWINVTNATGAFSNCSKLTSPPDVSGWVNVTNARNAFSNCSKLTSSPDVSGWVNVTNARNAFNNCAELTSPPDVSGWVNVTDAESAFNGCSELISPPDVSGWVNVTMAESAFNGCSKLTSPPDVSGWVNVTDARGAFFNCTGLISPPNVSGWVNVTNVESAFHNCTGLTSSLDISGWNPLKITDASSFMLNVSTAGFDTAAYDAALIAWDTNYDLTLVNTLSIHFGSAKYTTGGAAETARNLLAANGWTITDGGPAP